MYPKSFQTREQIDGSELRKVGIECNEFWSYAQSICSSEKVRSSLVRFSRNDRIWNRFTILSLNTIINVCPWCKDYNVPQALQKTHADRWDGINANSECNDLLHRARRISTSEKCHSSSICFWNVSAWNRFNLCVLQHRQWFACLMSGITMYPNSLKTHGQIDRSE